MIKREEINLIKDYNQLYQRALAVGITPIIEDGRFCFNDIPGSNGAVLIYSVQELSNFIYGYELGYRSGLKSENCNG